MGGGHQNNKTECKKKKRWPRPAWRLGGCPSRRDDVWFVFSAAPARRFVMSEERVCVSEEWNIPLLIRRLSSFIVFYSFIYIYIFFRKASALFCRGQNSTRRSPCFPARKLWSLFKNKLKKTPSILLLLCLFCFVFSYVFVVRLFLDGLIHILNTMLRNSTANRLRRYPSLILYSSCTAVETVTSGTLVFFNTIFGWFRTISRGVTATSPAKHLTAWPRFL